MYFDNGCRFFSRRGRGGVLALSSVVYRGQTTTSSVMSTAPPRARLRLSTDTETPHDSQKGLLAGENPLSHGETGMSARLAQRSANGAGSGGCN